MKTCIGIWLVRRRAIVATRRHPDALDDPEPRTEVTDMASGVEKRIRTAGGSRTGNGLWGAAAGRVGKQSGKPKQRLSAVFDGRPLRKQTQSLCVNRRSRFVRGVDICLAIMR